MSRARWLCDAMRHATLRAPALDGYFPSHLLRRASLHQYQRFCSAYVYARMKELYDSQCVFTTLCRYHTCRRLICISNIDTTPPPALIRRRYVCLRCRRYWLPHVTMMPFVIVYARLAFAESCHYAATHYMPLARFIISAMLRH